MPPDGDCFTPVPVMEVKAFQVCDEQCRWHSLAFPVVFSDERYKPLASGLGNSLQSPEGAIRVTTEARTTDCGARAAHLEIVVVTLF